MHTELHSSQLLHHTIILYIAYNKLSLKTVQSEALAVATREPGSGPACRVLVASVRCPVSPAPSLFSSPLESLCTQTQHCAWCSESAAPQSTGHVIIM